MKALQTSYIVVGISTQGSSKGKQVGLDFDPTSGGYPYWSISPKQFYDLESVYKEYKRATDPKATYYGGVDINTVQVLEVKKETSVIDFDSLVIDGLTLEQSKLAREVSIEKSIDLKDAAEIVKMIQEKS